MWLDKFALAGKRVTEDDRRRRNRRRSKRGRRRSPQPGMSKIIAFNQIDQIWRRVFAEVRWLFSGVFGRLTGWIVTSVEFVAVLLLLSAFFLPSLPGLVQSQPSAVIQAGILPAIPTPQGYRRVSEQTVSQLKKVLLGKDRVAHYERYFEYVDAQESRLSAPAYAFFADYNHYSLAHPNSLVNKTLKNVNASDSTLAITFAANDSDHTMTLRYDNVTDYSAVNEAAASDGVDELLAHELSLGDTGELTHTLVFSSSAVLQIVASDLSVLHNQD